MTSVLAFINRVRTILEGDEVPCIWLKGRSRMTSITACWSRALPSPGVPAEIPAWSDESQLVAKYTEDVIWSSPEVTTHGHEN